MKMKKIAILAVGAAALAMTTSASAEVFVALEGMGGKTVTVSQMPIGGKQDQAVNTELTLNAKGEGKFQQQPGNTAIYLLNEQGQRMAVMYSATPSENISLTMGADGTPLYSGTELMSDITTFDKMLDGFNKQAETVMAGQETDPVGTEQKMEQLRNDYVSAIKNFIATNANKGVALYAIRNLGDEDFLEAYNALTPAAKSGILMPLVESQKAYVEKQIEMNKKMEAMQDGKTPAPTFTLPDLTGKMMSLSDFRGKWVILDFWGSWCRWCIKGFPELKELQAQYGDKLAIVGIDCRDTPEKWKAAVEKYGLTWTNLYNDCSGDSNPLLDAYMVQGFPTKVIVNPEGIIAKIVIGADPEFPNILAGFINGK